MELISNPNTLYIGGGEGRHTHIVLVLTLNHAFEGLGMRLSMEWE